MIIAWSQPLITGAALYSLNGSVATRTTTRLMWGRCNVLIKPIKSESDHAAALREIERLWGAEEGTAEGDRLEVLTTLVEAYEHAYFPIAPPDPIEAIKFRLEQRGADRKALIGVIGNRTTVYEVLRRDRPLSLSMIRRLNQMLNIPAEVLIRPVRRRKRST
jgi:HTH-type transcriptional regulator / antitoxin HigA